MDNIIVLLCQSLKEYVLLCLKWNHPEVIKSNPLIPLLTKRSSFLGWLCLFMAFVSPSPIKLSDSFFCSNTNCNLIDKSNRQTKKYYTHNNIMLWFMQQSLRTHYTFIICLTDQISIWINTQFAEEWTTSTKVTGEYQTMMRPEEEDPSSSMSNHPFPFLHMSTAKYHIT